MKLISSALTFFSAILAFSEAGTTPRYVGPIGTPSYQTFEVRSEDRTANTSVRIPSEVQDAIAIVQDAQAKQAVLNMDRYAHPLRNIYTLRPESTETTNNVTTTLPSHIAVAATLVAEYEAGLQILKVSANNTAASEHGKRAASFWMEGISHGSVAIGGSAGYVVFRNVMDYGAKGDGSTDDTTAINSAISSGGRCGSSCGSSTVSPAIVYFPAGTYIVSSPIISYYNTQLIGNGAAPPTIKASSSFIGLGIISSDVYLPGASGSEWYINQNNFLRQVRNFVIDTTSIPNVMSGLTIAPAGIHWQVAQATSLQAITIKMPTTSTTTHVGIFMENGSGGFMSDVSITGGAIGAIFGNQQFTIRNFQFNNCKVAVEMLWDWAFTLKSFSIDNCQVAFNASGGGGGAGATQGQGTGSLTIIDTTISNTPIGVLSSVSGVNATSILLDHVQLSNVPVAVNNAGQTILAGGSTTIESWASGVVYSDEDSRGGGSPTRQANGPITADESWPKPSNLLGPGSQGWFERSKPQYTDTPVSGFWDVQAKSGAKGNGRSDDTAAINSALQAATTAGSIVWFPQGIYLVTDTIVVPPGARLVGEIWPQIMASGANFEDINNPHVMMQVGKPGDTGVIEMQDLIFTVRGATAGAVLMEWNIVQSSQGSAGLWDCHFRVGGAVGSDLQATDCPKQTASILTTCIAASLHLHVKGSGYFENMWAWTADHDMDVVAQTQISIFTGRGILIESPGPTWFYGTASEHNVLYQYQISASSDIFLGMIQTESPYFQGTPGAPAPFGNLTSTNATAATESRRSFINSDKETDEAYIEERSLFKRAATFNNDPTFSTCSPGDPLCAVSWGLRIISSLDIAVYGAGLYSWFQNYDQTCLAKDKCQTTMAYIDDSSSTKLRLHNIVTVGASIMLESVNGAISWASDNKNGFASSVLGWIVTLPASGDAAAGGTSLGGAKSFSTGASIHDADPDNTLGDALVIVSTNSQNPVGTLGQLIQDTGYYYYGIPAGSSFDCNTLTGTTPVAVDPTRHNTNPANYKSFPTLPDLGPPASSSQQLNLFGHSCQFTINSDQSWASAVGGSSTPIGYIQCDGNTGTVGMIPCVKPIQPSASYYQCPLIEYTIDAICYFPSILPRGAGNQNSKPALQLWEITATLFYYTLREFDYYQPNRQLFYTRRLEYIPGQIGLSDEAQAFARPRRWQTIWEGWPSVRIDGNAASYYDFYEVDDTNGWLRDIRQTIDSGPYQDGAAQNQYFQAMSMEFANRASGVVYVMTEDPTRTMMTAIWGEIEFPTLTRPGTPVTQIIATNPAGTLWYVIWDASDSTVTPTNPRQTSDPGSSRLAKRADQQASLDKRGLVVVGGELVDIGGTVETSPLSYGAECLNNGYWLLYSAYYCPGVYSVMTPSTYEQGQDFFG